MYRWSIILFCFILLSCKTKKTAVKEEGSFTFEGFSKLFHSATLPYQLTDDDLKKNGDTALIRSPEFVHFIADTIKNKIFGKGIKVKYTPLIKINVPKGESYFLIKATGNNKKGALLMSFDKEEKFVVTLPFLIPDEEPATTQISSIDKSYTISRSIIRRKGNSIVAEGKDVFVFNNDARQFTLIMTDLLDERNAELINPIDTFSHRNKFAGDYSKGKRNIIAIRDGHTTGQLLAFVHFEKQDDNCTGELKGELLFTSPTTAVFREGGDPCVLQFIFTTSSVMLKEEQGCGNHRGLNCVFEGTFQKKKIIKQKSSLKKGIKK